MKWEDVIKDERYTSLSAEGRMQLRDNYFNEVGIPKIDKNKIEQERQDFYSYTEKLDPSLRPSSSEKKYPKGTYQNPGVDLLTGENVPEDAQDPRLNTQIENPSTLQSSIDKMSKEQWGNKTPSAAKQSPEGIDIVDTAIRALHEGFRESSEYWQNEYVEAEKRSDLLSMIPTSVFGSAGKVIDVAKSILPKSKAELQEDIFVGSMMAKPAEAAAEALKHLGIKGKARIFSKETPETVAHEMLQDKMKESYDFIQNITKFRQPKKITSGGEPYTGIIKETPEEKGIVPFIKKEVKDIYDKTRGKNVPSTEVGKLESVQDPDVRIVLQQRIKDKQDIKAAQKMTFKKFEETFGEKFVDDTYKVRKALEKEDAFDVMMYRDMQRHTTAKSALIIDDLDKEVFSELPKKDIELLGDIRQWLRNIEISSYNPNVVHPGGVKSEQMFKALEYVKKEDPERFNRLMKVNEKIQKVYSDELRKYVDNGLIDETEFEKIMAKGEFYNPREFIQHIDPSTKRIKYKNKYVDVGESGMPYLDEGSMKALESNPRLLLQHYVSRMESRIAKNKANKELYNLAETNPENSVVKMFDEFVLKDGKLTANKVPSGKAVIHANIKGQKKAMIMDEDLAAEWKGLDPVFSESEAKWISWLSGNKLLKSSATHMNPEFGISNIPRDIAYVFFTNKGEYSSIMPKFTGQLLVDYAQTAKDALLKKGLYREAIERGGGFETLTQQGKLFDKHLKSVQDFMSWSGDLSERWTRLAVMNRALKNRISKIEKMTDEEIAELVKKGTSRIERGIDNVGQSGQKLLPEQKLLSDNIPAKTGSKLDSLSKDKRNILMNKALDEAVYAGVKYLDFNQGGQYAKAADAAIPFFNAAIQGTRGIVRAAKEDPKQFAFKSAQLAGMVSALTAYNLRNNPEAYKDIEDKIKSNNFIITTPFKTTDKYGNDKYLYLTIPKDQSQRILSSIFENVTNKILGEKVNWDQLGSSFQEMSQFIPGDTSQLSPIFKMGIGYFSGKNLYTMEDIYKGKKGKLKDEFTDYTPAKYVEFSKILDKSLGLDTSPERIKYMVDQIIAPSNVIGQWMGTAIDLPLRNKEENPLTADEILKTIPVARKIAKFTNPDVENLKTNKEIHENIASENIGIERSQQKIFDKIYKDYTSNKEIKSEWIGEHNDWLKDIEGINKEHYIQRFENFMESLDIDKKNYRWWMQFKTEPSAKAQAMMFNSKYKDLNEDRKNELIEKAARYKVFDRDKFQYELNKLKR